MPTSSSKAQRKDTRSARPKKAVSESTRPPASKAAARTVGAIRSATSKQSAARKSSVPPKQAAVAAAPRIAVDSSARAGDKQELKAQLGRLSGATSQIASLKRNLGKSFFDVGLILSQLKEQRLYEVKGYGSFEAFLERELDLNKVSCLRMARIAEVLRREDAVAAGFERASAAVAALDGEAEPTQGFRPAGSPASALPLHKQ
jgi:hypothetical protein